MRKIELTGKIVDMSIDFLSGKPKLMLELNENQTAKALYDSLKDCDKLSIKIAKYREKRSLNANAYMWTLCTKLAEERSKDGIKVTKDDVYREEIRALNVCYDDEIEPEKVKWRCTAWEMIGTGWITERVDFTADGNKEIIRFYYGSSRYNTKQMSRLIDNIVQDCKAVGIETKTPEELERLKSLWGCEGE